MNTHKETNTIIKRLIIIEGHIRGIQKMLDENKPCEDILIQFSAVKSALIKAERLVLEDHFENCIINKITDKTLEDELRSFKDTILKFEIT